MRKQKRSAAVQAMLGDPSFGTGGSLDAAVDITAEVPAWVMDGGIRCMPRHDVQPISGGLQLVLCCCSCLWYQEHHLNAGLLQQDCGNIPQCQRTLLLIWDGLSRNNMLQASDAPGRDRVLG